MNNTISTHSPNKLDKEMFGFTNNITKGALSPRVANKASFLHHFKEFKKNMGKSKTRNTFLNNRK